MIGWVEQAMVHRRSGSMSEGVYVGGMRIKAVTSKPRSPE